MRFIRVSLIVMLVLMSSIVYASAETYESNDKDDIILLDNMVMYIILDSGQASLSQMNPEAIIEAYNLLKEYIYEETGKENVFYGLKEVNIYPTLKLEDRLGDFRLSGIINIYESPSNAGVDTFLHELGHYIDRQYLTTDDRKKYLEIRGLEDASVNTWNS